MAKSQAVFWMVPIQTGLAPILYTSLPVRTAVGYGRRLFSSSLGNLSRYFNISVATVDSNDLSSMSILKGIRVVAALLGRLVADQQYIVAGLHCRWNLPKASYTLSKSNRQLVNVTCRLRGRQSMIGVAATSILSTGRCFSIHASMQASSGGLISAVRYRHAVDSVLLWTNPRPAAKPTLALSNAKLFQGSSRTRWFLFIRRPFRQWRF